MGSYETVLRYITGVSESGTHPRTSRHLSDEDFLLLFDAIQNPPQLDIVSSFLNREIEVAEDADKIPRFLENLTRLKAGDDKLLTEKKSVYLFERK